MHGCPAASMGYWRPVALQLVDFPTVAARQDLSSRIVQSRCSLASEALNRKRAPGLLNPDVREG